MNKKLTGDQFTKVELDSIENPFTRIISIQQYNSLSETDKTNCRPLKEYGQNSVSIWAYSQSMPKVFAPTEIGEETFDFGHNNGVLPCPFCGGTEGDNVILGYEYPNYRIACVPCAVVMRHDRKDKVIGMWNNQSRLFTRKQVLGLMEKVKERQISILEDNLIPNPESKSHIYFNNGLNLALEHILSIDTESIINEGVGE